MKVQFIVPSNYDIPVVHLNTNGFFRVPIINEVVVVNNLTFIVAGVSWNLDKEEVLVSLSSLR